MTRPFTIGVMAALGCLLAGCGDSGTVRVSNGGMIRAEGACDVAGLARPLRQTLILVDAKAMQKAADAAEFSKNDTAFRDLMLAIADPGKAIPSGTTAARERVTIGVVPSNGSAADTTFTGCLPGMSADELTQATKNRSALDSAFAAGPAGQIDKDVEAFRLQLIGGLVGAAGKAEPGAAAQTGPVSASRFLQGVRASSALWTSKDFVSRVILVSDLSNLTLPGGAPLDTFAAGVKAGHEAGGDFDRAELHLLYPAGRPVAGRDFFRGYFLAQNGQLAALEAGRVGVSGPIPTRLWRFAGEAAYPSGPQLVDIRIGDDGHGKLASAWLTVLGDPRFSIPMTGQIICTASDACKITSDNAGFAQVWTVATGDAPKFDNNLPFAGMRNFAFEIAGSRLTGRVFDDSVYLGDDKSKNAIPVHADIKQ